MQDQSCNVEWVKHLLTSLSSGAPTPTLSLEVADSGQPPQMFHRDSDIYLIRETVATLSIMGLLPDT